MLICEMIDTVKIRNKQNSSILLRMLDSTFYHYGGDIIRLVLVNKTFIAQSDNQHKWSHISRRRSVIVTCALAVSEKNLYERVQ